MVPERTISTDSDGPCGTSRLADGWIPTGVSGNTVFPLDAAPAVIDIRDIAHALACINRFTGHVPSGPYCVAQHSVYVARLFEGEPLELAALLHDAAEAYLGDIARPWKQALRVQYSDGHSETIKEAEERLLRVIFDALRVPWPTAVQWKMIKDADTAVLVAEGFDLFSDTPSYPLWTHRVDNGFARAPFTVRPWTWERARAGFQQRYDFLQAKGL